MVNGEQPGDARPSDEGASPPAAAPRKGRSRAPASSKAAAKRPCSLSQMVLQAFESCTERRGLSVAALKKQLAEAGYDAHRHSSRRLKRQLSSLVSHGLLTRLSGTSGASGSFKFNRQAKPAAGKAQSPQGGKKKKRAKAAAAATQKSPPARMSSRDPPKKAQKKQPPINKPKGLKGKKAAQSGNRNPPAASTRSLPAKRGARRT